MNIKIGSSWLPVMGIFPVTILGYTNKGDIIWETASGQVFQRSKERFLKEFKPAPVEEVRYVNITEAGHSSNPFKTRAEADNDHSGKSLIRIACKRLTFKAGEFDS